MCDLRYVEEKSCLGFNNQKLGIPLLNGGPQRLANLIGVPKTIDFLLTDRQIYAEETVELGIASGMVQDGTGMSNIFRFEMHYKFFSIVLNLCYFQVWVQR